MIQSPPAPYGSTHSLLSEHAEHVSFGDFALYPTARVLKRRGVTLPVGSRALDILIVLVEHAGEVVSHRELMSKVWRGLVVDYGNLRVQVNGLRKALGDDTISARYVANIPGQGYSFVAPIERIGAGTPGARPGLQQVLDAITSAIGVPLEDELALAALVERLSRARRRDAFTAPAHVGTSS